MKQEKEAKKEMHKMQDLVEQKKQYIESGKILHYNPIIKQNVAFLGFHRNYLSAFKNNKLELKTDKIGENEIFTTIPITKGIEDQTDNRCKVAIQPYGTNLYLCCAKDGSLMFQEYCRSYEQWIVEKEENTGMFSFKSCHNTYLCAEKNGIPNGKKKKKKDWEKWRIIVVQVQETKDKENEGKTTKGQPMHNENGNYYDNSQKQKMAENNGSYY